MAHQPDPDGLDSAEAFVRRVNDEHGAALYGWAARRLGDRSDAEEAVAESMVKAWRSYDQFDPSKGTEKAWLFAILRNTAADVHRSRSRHLRAVEGPPPESAVDSEIESVVEASLVREALMELSARHREVVIHAHFAGRTIGQIAEQLGIPEGTVKSRLHYAMRSLRGGLEERGILR